jgi:hypothetical protein
MKLINKTLLFSAIDLGAFLFLLILFMMFFLAPFQEALLESYGSVEFEQTSEADYVSIGSTSVISVLLFSLILVSVLLYYVIDTVKFASLRKKNPLRKIFLRNALVWFAFAIAFIFIGLVLQQLYFFFVLVSFLKPLFFILCTFVWSALLLFILLVGKQKIIGKKVKWGPITLQWALLAVLTGILVITSYAFLIAIAALCCVFLYNYTLIFVTRQ